MGAGYLYICCSCGYSIATSGPWEFYQDTTGQHQLLNHNTYSPTEYESCGIKGLSANMYCSVCDKVYEIILIQLDHTAHTDFELWSAWCDPRVNLANDHSITCPTCDNAEMLLEPNEKRIVTCPHCKKGILYGKLDWIA